ncbi:TPA: YagK/YfjJ domain-containing protein [Pseudomonas aeruginosa]|nr:inovirus Gp2 family protein [Pseudomonas aeruginosa]MCO3818133.1 inovirus Gp2 family protein [Pseudomonas aeruginosa]HBP5584185.1 inovirus Gp2 family protein [Pseudomonas aeruginosa]
MRINGEHDERYIALLNKGAMACGEDGLFKAGGVDIGTILQLKKFSEMAREFAESLGVAFEFDGGRIVPTSVGRSFVKLIGKGGGWINEAYALEPYSQLIVDEIDWPSVSMLLSHVKYFGDSMQVLEALNGLADHIRERARSSGFNARLNSYHRSSNKNYRGLMKYEQALFECHSKMLVLRIDFSYRKEHCKVSQKIALQHRKRLFDNARSNKLFKHMLGYVTKLEHGVEKGFHFHCMFFFDGAKVREDITLAKRIGEYWVSVVTKGIGCYYNCNYAKEKYRRCGIGMVIHADMEKREDLRLAMVYLTKTDLYMKLKAEGRAMTKGVMPTAPSGRGRPRAIVVPE